MILWVKALRSIIFILSGFLTLVGFHIGRIEISWLVVCTVMLITCASMLQNDWRDRYHDIRKGKLLVTAHLKTFLIVLVTFWISTLFLILWVCQWNIMAGLILVAMALSGLIYSEVRKIPLLPLLLVVATFSSSSLLSLAMGGDSYRVTLLFISSVLIVSGREIMTDIRDVEIDRGYKATLPILLGIPKAKFLACTLIIVGSIVATCSFSVIWTAPLIVLFGVILFVFCVNIKISKSIIDVGIIGVFFSILFS